MLKGEGTGLLAGGGKFITLIVSEYVGKFDYDYSIITGRHSNESERKLFR